MKLKKKNCGTQVHGARTRVPQFFLRIFYFLFLSFIWHNSILNQLSFTLKLEFKKIEFQNRDMDLNCFKTETYY